MNKPLKLIKIGNSTGVVLPKDVLARLRVAQGDDLFLSEIDSGITLRAHDEAFAVQIEVARDVMRRRRAALRELAK